MSLQSLLVPAVTATITASTSVLLSNTTTTAPAAPTIPGGGGGATGDDPGDDQDTLRNWSSLIGIVTAIVGNILIALALNVQRYAHTRLNKERARVKQRARAILKRAQSSSNGGGSAGHAGGSYGAIAGTDNGHANGHGTTSAAVAADEYPSAENDPLSASFQSDATTVSEDDAAVAAAAAGKTSSNYLKSPYWWLGQILITLGEMGNFLAYGFAPASIVSPLGVVALVSNCIIAPAMFHERFRSRDFWGVVIAVAGVVTVVLSAKTEETKLKPGDILDAITTPAFEIYLGLTVPLIAVLMWASGKYGRRTSLIDLGLVGLFGGYTALATKGVSSMLSSTLWRAFTAPLTYLLLFILLGTAIMQIRYVNKALQRFDSTQVIPIQFVMFTLCVIVGSAVLYRDFEKTTPERAAKFVGGCLLTFFGVFLITSGRQRRDEDEEFLDDAEGIDETIGLIDQEGNPAAAPEDGSRRDAPSRRSSKVSRVSFAEPFKTTLYQDVPESAPATPRPNNALAGSPPSRNPETPGGGGQGNEPWPPRATRTLSSNSVASAPVPPNADIPTTPPTQREQQQQAMPPGAERPVTPRTSTTTPKSTTRDRDRTFYSPSPLYSTVTTVVKDALRENASSGNYNNNNQSSLRSIRSSIRASLFIDSDEEEGGEEHDTQQTIAVPPSENDLMRVLTAPEHDDEDDDEGAAARGSNRQRARSLSETVGKFFRSRKKARINDVESGPSGGEDGDDNAGSTA
ncbi:DUF803 domain membrane protein [Cordyceps fumosorosea ARSEF 2679]|uniref:DUF803 domain membrane protein n=1 Tax=Cordyceps fumosorosea (strain ARSEF 2679) TaxID=1081104 RepID=A0A167S8A5_CORFA|nr:DUF803 domain membrane protein [Cordyceps fumosorosea ARSEF 2679]OAA59360.1 DUF803 domain membrane protein [Cordyceps fumosorosea ARSEF 2679]